MQTTDIELQRITARKWGIDLDRVLLAEKTLDFWQLSHADAWELKLRFEESNNVAGHRALVKWFLFVFRKSLNDPHCGY